MQKLALPVALTALLCACLDARHGAAGGDAALNDAHPPGCSVGDLPAAPIERYNVDTALIGPCGHVAYTGASEGGGVGDYGLHVLDPSGANLAVVPLAEGGYGAQLTASPWRDAFAVRWLRSDLGFGDLTWVSAGDDLVYSGPHHVGAHVVSGFFEGPTRSGLWRCSGDFGGANDTLVVIDAAGEHALGPVLDCDEIVARDTVLIAPRADGLGVWDLETGALYVRAEVLTVWQAADTGSYHDRSSLTGDGGLILTQRRWLGVEAGAAERPDGKILVWDKGDTEVPRAEVDGDLSTLVTTPASSAFAVTVGDSAVAWYRTDGGWVTVDDSRGAVLIDGGGRLVTTTQPMGTPTLAVLGWEPDGVVPAPVATNPTSWVLSPGDEAIAVAHRDEHGGSTVSVYRDGRATALARFDGAPLVRAVTSAGAVLLNAPGTTAPGGGITIPGAPTLLSPAGAVLWRGPVGEVTAVRPAGAVLIVTVKTANEEVIAVDTATGRSEVLVTGRFARVSTDDGGLRVVISYRPLSAANFGFYFGAVPFR